MKGFVSSSGCTPTFPSWGLRRDLQRSSSALGLLPPDAYDAAVVAFARPRSPDGIDSASPGGTTADDMSANPAGMRTGV